MRLVAAVLALAALLALAPAPAPAAEDDAAALVAAWQAAEGRARYRLAGRLRALGAKAAPALRAAAGSAEVGMRKRLDALLARIRVDHHRAHTPAGMVYVPAGAVEVPRSKAPWGPSGTRRQVGAFYMQRTEVTVGAWRTWLAGLEQAEPGAVRRRGIYQPPADRAAKLPITRVRHVDAQHYAKEHGGRLPTVEEFERALRGSGVATWPWAGRTRAVHANLRELGPGRLMPVGSYPKGASAFGLLDLVGNAAEWTATFVPQGTRGRFPLLAGGAYIHGPEPALTWRGRLRGSARVGSRERQPWVGFRLVKDPPRLPE